MANIIFQSCTTIIQTKPYSTTNELIIQVNETDLRKSFLLEVKNATRSPRRTYLKARSNKMVMTENRSVILAVT